MSDVAGWVFAIVLTIFLVERAIRLNLRLIKRGLAEMERAKHDDSGASGNP
jgi:hypothetical protein